MDTAAVALRISKAALELENYGPLAKALLLAGVVLLLSLFVGFVFWRIYRTSRNR